MKVPISIPINVIVEQSPLMGTRMGIIRNHIGKIYRTLILGYAISIMVTLIPISIPIMGM